MYTRAITAILLVIIFVLSLLSRSIEVLNKNYIFGFDQGRDYLAVKSILIDRKITLIGSEVGAGAAGLNGIFQGPFHYYFLSIPFVLTKGDPYGGLVLMFLFSMLSVILSYFLGKKVFGVVGGLIFSLIMALSPMFIAQARFVWNSNPSTLFILLTFYFIYKGLKKESKYIFLSAFFAGFIYNFQFAVAIPLCIAMFLFYLVIVKLRDVKKYIILFAGFILAFSPMIIFESRHNFIGIRGLVGYLFSNKDSGTTFLPTQEIIKNHLSSFFNAFMDVFPKIMSPHILILIVLVPAIYFLIKEKDETLRKFIKFLFLLFPIYFFVFLFFRNAVWVYYLIALNIVYILLFSYSVASAFKKNNQILKIFYVLFILFILVKTWPMLVRVFNYDYQDYGGTAKIKGKVDAIDFIYNDAKGKKFSLFIFSPPIYTYPYDYILWWYGKNKYGHLPDNKKTGLFYTLIEKDNDQPWRHEGWLETVIKDGVVVWEKELSNGFIVQKRIAK